MMPLSRYSAAIMLVCAPLLIGRSPQPPEQPSLEESPGFVQEGGNQPAAIDPAELETFADEFFATHMAELDIPGATLAVVQDGKVLLAKGYGVADIEHGIPFDPDQTVVRIGSVSKLFVATAVMQLVEQGQLDLNADVNQYLTTFQTAQNYPQPVTIAHLLTHTAGFDTPYRPFNMDPAYVQPLETYVRENLPARVRPAGDVIAYSNYGYALLGYIVEVVSGVPFDQYVQENILTPLGMEHSRYFYKPPLPEGLATGYSFLQGDERAPQPPDYDSEYPGGALVSTASDMAKFMLAHLENGCYEGVCILKPETVAEMHRQQFTNHPELGGWTYGFTEQFLGSHRVIGHSGATLGFGNSLDLVPEHNLGIFLSFNLECLGSSACQILSQFRQQFAKRFLPSEAESPEEFALQTDVRRLAGAYRQIWYPHSTTEKIRVLAQPDLQVTATEGGILVGGVRYVEIAPLTFQEVGGDQRIGFRMAGNGSVSYLFYGAAYERLPWYETGVVASFLFDYWGWLWGAVLLAWAGSMVVRRLRKLPAPEPLVARLHGLIVAVSVLHICFLVSLIRLFWLSPEAATAMLFLPLVAAILTLGMAIMAGIMWRRGSGSVVGRVGYTLITLMALLFLGFLNQWNFIGFHVR